MFYRAAHLPSHPCYTKRRSILHSDYLKRQTRLRITNNNTPFPEPLFTVLICSFSADYQVWVSSPSDDRKFYSWNANITNILFCPLSLPIFVGGGTQHANREYRTPRDPRQIFRVVINTRHPPAFGLNTKYRRGGGNERHRAAIFLGWYSYRHRQTCVCTI